MICTLITVCESALMSVVAATSTMSEVVLSKMLSMVTKVERINLRNAIDGKGTINGAGTIGLISVINTKGSMNTVRKVSVTNVLHIMPEKYGVGPTGLIIVADRKV